MILLIENWYIIIALIVLLTFVSGIIFAFLTKPTKEQLNKVKEWLLFAVVQAEKELGHGTGRIKLRYVYDLFIIKFKWISRLISFEMFSNLVDGALDEMREMLATNSAVHRLVNKEGE